MNKHTVSQSHTPRRQLNTLKTFEFGDPWVAPKVKHLDESKNICQEQFKIFNGQNDCSQKGHYKNVIPHWVHFATILFYCLINSMTWKENTIPVIDVGSTLMSQCLKVCPSLMKLTFSLLLILHNSSWSSWWVRGIYISKLKLFLFLSKFLRSCFNYSHNRYSSDIAD